jgi:hypothetical protein
MDLSTVVFDENAGANAGANAGRTASRRGLENDRKDLSLS